MELKQLTCPSCIAAVQVPTNMDRITCAYCGSELIIEHGRGNMNPAPTQKVEETIRDVGQETQGAIRKSTGVTRTELQRLQIGQQIGMLQIQLSGIRTEIRVLEREKSLSRAAKGQLKALRKEEQDCLLQIHNLQSFLSKTGGGHQTLANIKIESSAKPSRWKLGCFLSFVAFIMVGTILSIFAIPADIGTGVGLIIAIFVFLYFLFPNASLWKRLPIIGKPKT